MGLVTVTNEGMKESSDMTEPELAFKLRRFSGENDNNDDDDNH